LSAVIGFCIKEHTKARPCKRPGFFCRQTAGIAQAVAEAVAFVLGAAAGTGMNTASAMA